MRNLKRALSLTLASVMLLGMMVVGSSAAGFPDVDEENNVEAIEVLNAVDVIRGYDNGDFGPDDLVTRSQMAVIMANLLKLDYQYYEATCPFTDVPEWARGYVGACYANGITSGYSATIYGANDGITPVQAASMMMRALGYFKYAEDYSAGFEVVTVRQGSEVGIFEGVGSSATAQMTRDQVARMALNALESEMVSFTGTPGIEVNGSVVGYRAEYTPRTSTELKYKAIEDRTSDVASEANHKGQYYIQLGEELYDGKLVKKFDRDEFERPSINWQYDGKEIGVYVDYDLKVAEYLSAVKYNTLYDELTYTTIRDNDVLRFVDGKETTPFSKDNFARSNKNDLEGSGTGVLTEVFFDQDNDEITITSINTYLAQANSDYNTTNESLSMKVYDSKTGTTKIVDSTDVPAAANVKKDEYRLVYMSAKENPSYEVVRMFDVEIMPDSEVTKWSKDGTKVVSSLTTGGTDYSANVKAFYDKDGDVFEDYDNQLLTDITYNIYLDRYGNVIGVDEAEGVRNYVFITGYDRGKSHIATKTADANAIFLDGTMDVITVNVTDTNKNISSKLNMGTYDVWNIQDGKVNENRWYTFTQSANGNYTLKPVARSIYTAYTSNDLGASGVKTLNTANLYLDDSHRDNDYIPQGRIYGNDDSIYITVEPGRVDLSCNVPGHDVNSTTNTSIDNVKDAITDVGGVYTGAQNVKIDLSLETKQEINRDGRYDENGNVASDKVCETGHDEHGDTNYKSSNERNAYVYSIYDSNYYIIASVVLGEAQGGAANYVYVLGDAKNERVERGSGSNGDTYYWEFEAVVDGEITTLTVKEKYSDTLKNTLKIHAMQEIRFDGDYVTAIKDIPVNDVFINFQGADTAKVVEKVKTDDMDVYDVGYVYNQGAWKAVGDYMDGDGMPTKAYESTKMAEMRDIFKNDGRINGTIQLVGRTLYTDRDNGDVGLALNTNAKAVLIQPENGKRVATNCGSVSEAIGRLADRYPDETTNPGIQFQGRIAAVLDSNGAAKWVVIISDTNLTTGNNPNYGNTGRTYYLDLSGELFSGYSNSTSVWSSAENNNRGGYVEGYNLNSSTSGWGNTTRYEVRSGSTVVVRNAYTDAQMNWYFNNVYMDDIMEWNGRDGYTFVMPSENVAIEGRHNMRYTENIAGFTSEKIGNNAVVAFNTKGTGVDLGAGVTTVNVEITMPGRSVSSLENGKYYTVTIGEYQTEIDVLCAGNTLSFEYTVTARDRNAKRIMVWDINLASNQTGTPVEPGTTSVNTVVIDSADIPSSFESADKVPAGAQTLTVVTDPANAATVTLTWGTAADGKVTGTISVTANAGYNLTGTKITLGGVEITNGYTVTATVGSNEGEDVTVKLGKSAEDDTAAKAVTAKAANGKVAVTGLSAGKNLRAIVAVDGKEVENIEADGSMDWPENAVLWVLKGRVGYVIDKDTGLVLPGEITFDYAANGITPASRMRMARTAEEPRTYTFTDRYLGYATITLGKTSYTLEMVSVKFSDGTTAPVAFKFLKKDINAVSAWIANENNDLEAALDTIDEDWTEDYVPIELPGKADIVTIPLIEGERVLNVEYTPDENSLTEENANLVIKAKPGVEQKYEINGELVTEEGMTPTESDTAEPVDKNDPLVTGLRFTLKASDENTALVSNGKTKVSAIQKNVDVNYNEETMTFTVTGDLTYQKALTDYSSDTDRQVGYFVALDLDWSDMPASYEIKLGTYKDNDPAEFVLKPVPSEGNSGKTELILGKVATGDGKKLELEGRGIQVTDTRNNDTKFYTFDFSGLTTDAPELISFTEVGKDATKLGEKEISAIQTDVKVDVVPTSDTERTVKLTGTLHPVTEAWNNFSSSEKYNTGYIVAIQADGSAVADTTINAINPNGKPGALTTLNSDVTLYVRVADLADPNKQAKTNGNAVIYASNGGRMVTYTLDFSGLTLEQVGSGDAKLTAPGTVTLGKTTKNTSEFQKNVNVTKRGDTFYISGELNPIEWKDFSKDDKYQKGYYIAVNIDAGDVAGAAAWTAQGTTIGNTDSVKDDLVIFLGDADLTDTKDSQYKLYVLNKKSADTEKAPTEGVLKTYTLDFSGVTLVADPGAKPVADYDQITGLGSSVMSDDTTKAKLFYGTDIQDGVTFTYDASTKTYTAQGTLYKVNNWVGFSQSKPETRNGWYVALKIKGSYAGDPTVVDKTENGTNKITGGETCVIRVADKDGSAAAQELYFKVGEDKEAVTIKIDLSGLTLSETVATPTGQLVDLKDANIKDVASAGSAG